MKKQSKPRRSVPKAKKVQKKGLFRLIHKNHTGRMVHKTHTSYPILAMLVLFVGVFLVGWTRAVTATGGSYDVSARVEGTPPTQAATIDIPHDLGTFTQEPIQVSGTCPLNTYVELLRNNFSSGYAICDATGHYSLSTDLFTGANTLIARVYNLADVVGPDSQPVHVTYNPPAKQVEKPVVSSGSTDKTVAQATFTPLIAKTDFVFQGANVGDWISWTIDITGGKAPYAVAVDWGDGERDLYSRSKSGTMKIEHRYKKAGGYKGAYIIKVSVSDGEGKTTFLQFLSIVNQPEGVTGGSMKVLKKGVLDRSSVGIDKWAKYAWQGYSASVLMLASFWLGEVRQLRLHKGRVHKKPRIRR